MPAKKRPKKISASRTRARLALDEDPPVIVRAAPAKKKAKKKATPKTKKKATPKTKKKATPKTKKQSKARRLAPDEDPPVIVRLARPAFAGDEDPPVIVRGGSLTFELGKLKFEDLRVPRQPSKFVQTLLLPIRQLALQDETGVWTYHSLRDNQGCVVSISYTDPNASLDLPVNVTIRGRKIEIDVAPLSFDDFTLIQGDGNELKHPITKKEITDVTVIYQSGVIDHYPIAHPAYAISFDTRSSTNLRQLAEQQE